MQKRYFSRSDIKIEWLAIGFTILILVIIIAADLGILPREISALYAFPQGDKVGHFLLFGVLSFLITSAIPPAPRKQTLAQSILIANIIIVLIVGIEELSQGLLFNRNSSWVDLLSS